MTAYILSLLLSLGLTHLIHQKAPVTLCVLAILSVIAGLFLFLLFLGHVAVPGTYLFNVAVIVEATEFAQAVYGAGVGVLLHYWFSKDAFGRVEVVGAAAAAVMLGFFLPAAARWPATLTEVSLPFGSFSFAPPVQGRGEEVFTGDQNTSLFQVKREEPDVVAQLMKAIANPEAKMGHIQKDIVFAKVEESSEVGTTMAGINRFVADAIQPLFACLQSIKEETRGTYLGDEIVLSVAASLRAALAIEGDERENRWSEFQQDYANAQLKLLRRIDKYKIALTSDEDSSLACRLALPGFAHPRNPFDEILPYGRMTLALLLQAGGQRDAAVHELARWLVHSKSSQAFGSEVGRPSWFRLRALLYLADLMKQGRNVPEGLFELIRSTFQQEFGMPASADEMKDFMKSCEDRKIPEKELALSYIGWIREELGTKARRADFALEIAEAEEALNRAELLAEINFRCFSPPIDKYLADRFAASTHTVVAETYMNLARANELKDRAGTLEHQTWKRLARGYFRKAIPILKELAEDEHGRNLSRDNDDVMNALYSSNGQQLEYARVRQLLLSLRLEE